MAKNGYIGIGSKARKVKNIYIGVNGVARKVKNAYIGVNGVAHEWFSSDVAIGSLPVGSSVFMNVDNVRTEFIVVHQGIPNTTKYDSSCNGTWLLMKDLRFGTCAFSENYYTSYSVSDICEYLKRSGLARFDSNIQSIIKTVKIPYCAGSGSMTVYKDKLSVKLFSLSAAEVNFSGEDIPIDGAVLDYFKGGGNSKRIAYNSTGTAHDWWLRSSSTRYDEDAESYIYACLVEDTGNVRWWDTDYYRHIRPAMILPPDVLLDDNNNVIA